MKHFTSLLLLFITLFLPMQSQAERAHHFGDYVVHYNALRSDTIPPEVARRHSIVRSTHRGLLNIAVLKKHADGTTQAVAAKVWGSSRNLIEQRNELEFFKVQEQDAIYYLDQFRINDHDILRFEIHVIPEGISEQTQGTVKFTQRFYTE